MTTKYVILDGRIVNGNSMSAEFKANVLQGKDAGFRTYFESEDEAKSFIQEHGEDRKGYIILPVYFVNS